MGLFTERKLGYALDADVDRTRLVDQAKIIDRISERYMSEAGIAPGMRVLDLGSGMGDVALLAGRLVGPAGHVLGVERSSELLEAAQQRIDDLGVTNVELVEGDVTQLPQLGGRPFDAVVGRLILMHVPHPAAVLRAAAALVRRGGPVVAMGTADEIDVDTLAARLRAAVVAAGGVAASPVLVGALGRA